MSRKSSAPRSRTSWPEHQEECQPGKKSTNSITSTTFARKFSDYTVQVYPLLSPLTSRPSPPLILTTPRTVVGTYREAITDLTICNTYIPKGTAIFIQPAVTNLSKTIWGPDAEEFVPERWDNLTGEMASPYSWNPFLNGPRMCIGKTFALMEAKAQLVEVVSNFRFVMSPELEALGGRLPAVLNPAVSLSPKGGLRVGVERL